MAVKKKLVKDTPARNKKAASSKTAPAMKKSTRAETTKKKTSSAKSKPAGASSKKASARSRKKPEAEEAKQEDAMFEEATNQREKDTADPEYDGLLGGMANKATKIIEQAASILEEEIAAGIVAARNVEEKYVNVSNLRVDDPERVMQRFRKDTHDVVDILLDLVNVSVNSLGGFARRVVTVRSSPSAASNAESGGVNAPGVPVLTIPGTLRQNERGEVSMSVENDSGQSTEEFTFKCTGLLSDGEYFISAENIQVNPENIVVGPNTFEKVVIAVNVPKNTSPGVYSGLLQATKLTHVRAMLTVVVEE